MVQVHLVQLLFNPMKFKIGDILRSRYNPNYKIVIVGIGDREYEFAESDSLIRKVESANTVEYYFEINIPAFTKLWRAVNA